ncbi:MAG: radical SAM protein [Planctomycetaceae bacterium]|jgi:wyosine [tRNA(Phe)-imidazoG37] synthetase (radical SAM superfamily)|nr:radical SAM protein [Planctomycetaceae bacterium]
MPSFFETFSLSDKNNQLLQDHSRNYSQQQYVYPVVSRRSRGISIGINMSPTGLCNFHCVYCQVLGESRLTETQRQQPMPAIALDVLENELRQTLTAAINGELFRQGVFSQTPQPMRHINDIAFSGNGEPTLSPQFYQAVQVAANVRRELNADNVKLVVITNATQLQRHEIVAAMETLFANHGEVWAKLDAGTDSYYKKIDRSHVPFDTIINNITTLAKQRPLVIQTMLLKLHGEPIADQEVRAYIERIQKICESGGKIQRIQLYSIARGTAETYAEPLDNTSLDAIAERIRNETHLCIETFYGIGKS